jgi:hypothetical protein
MTSGPPLPPCWSALATTSGRSTGSLAISWCRKSVRRTSASVIELIAAYRPYGSSPTARLVRQVLAGIAAFDKGMIVAKLKDARGARTLKGATAGDQPATHGGDESGKTPGDKKLRGRCGASPLQKARFECVQHGASK